MHNPPPTLQIGRLYTVGLGARVKDPGDSTIAYTAEFCMIRGSAGEPRVHEVCRDEKNGGWNRAVCTLPLSGRNS